jgi:hypothetical protein
MKNELLILGFALAFAAGAFMSSPVVAQSYDDAYDQSYEEAAIDDGDDGIADDDDAEFDGDAFEDGDADDNVSVMDDGSEDYEPGTAVGSAHERCAARFRSFEPQSGTYVTYGGDRVLCPYL